MYARADGYDNLTLPKGISLLQNKKSQYANSVPYYLINTDVHPGKSSTEVCLFVTLSISTDSNHLVVGFSVLNTPETTNRGVMQHFIVSSRHAIVTIIWF